MGNKKKFDKIEPNDTYYETHEDEIDSEQKTKKEKKVKKPKFLPGIDAGHEPQKEKLPSRFTYKREKRKVVDSQEEKGVVEAPPKAPYVYTLVVMCLVLVMSFVVTSNIYASLSDTVRAVSKMLMYLAAFVVPTAVYLILPQSGKSLHNIRKFSAPTLVFSASCLGLLICLTALQKYLIAYSFSYSEPMVQVEGGVLLSIVTGALLPAVCEELFVRGVLQYEISKYAGGLCGVTVGALVFAMLHYELQYFLIYFVSGLVLGCVTHVTRSVFPAMLVHFLNNTLSILFSNSLSVVATERIGGAMLIIVLASLCFGFLILTLHLAEKLSEKRARKYLKEENSLQEGEELKPEKNMFFVLSPDKKTGSRFLKVLVSPPMLVCYAVFVVIAFIKL
ncbi:MAG: CPBP family intramembrane metalloprotease [Clostridia bacterium]|nr:CPBP family intramembrane metalloprotease [Clostridia bacterium]